MANMIEKNLGPVTAFGYAKKHGYKGTEEEFGAEQAGFAANARQVATDKDITINKAEAAKNSATTAENAAAASITSETNATTSASEAKASETNAKASETNVTSLAEQVATDKAAASEAASNASAAAQAAEQSAQAAAQSANQMMPNIQEAITNANNATIAAEKVDISAKKTPTGVVITTTNRQGITTETKLDSLIQINTWKDIENIVTAGLAKKYLRVGNAYNVKYKDPNTQKLYEVPWNHVGIRNVITPSGETKEAAIFQPGRVLPEEVMFDAWEAFYAVKEKPLEPGIYHVVMAVDWDNIKMGDAWSFTLTKPIPVGGVITGFRNAPSVVNLSETSISSFAKLTDTSAIETVALRKGAEGTKLGEFTKEGNAQLNSIQKVAYGNANYEESYQRQYLNSTGKGWWIPKNEYDCPPDDNSRRFGFKTGWDAEFLSVLKPFKSITARNNVADGGGQDETFDLFTLPSLEEMYIKKQVSGEGEYLPYWKEASPDGLEFPWYKPTPELIHLDVNGTARFVRLRSAHVNYSYYAWYVFSSGYVGTNYARDTYCAAPLAAIY